MLARVHRLADRGYFLAGCVAGISQGLANEACKHRPLKSTRQASRVPAKQLVPGRGAKPCSIFVSCQTSDAKQPSASADRGLGGQGKPAMPPSATVSVQELGSMGKQDASVQGTSLQDASVQGASVKGASLLPTGPTSHVQHGQCTCCQEHAGMQQAIVQLSTDLATALNRIAALEEQVDTLLALRLNPSNSLPSNAAPDIKTVDPLPANFALSVKTVDPASVPCQPHAEPCALHVDTASATEKEEEEKCQLGPDTPSAHPHKTHLTPSTHACTSLDASYLDDVPLEPPKLTLSAVPVSSPERDSPCSSFSPVLGSCDNSAAPAVWGEGPRLSTATDSAVPASSVSFKDSSVVGEVQTAICQPFSSSSSSAEFTQSSSSPAAVAVDSAHCSTCCPSFPSDADLSQQVGHIAADVPAPSSSLVAEPAAASSAAHIAEPSSSSSSSCAEPADSSKGPPAAGLSSFPSRAAPKPAASAAVRANPAPIPAAEQAANASPRCEIYTLAVSAPNPKSSQARSSANKNPSSGASSRKAALLGLLSSPRRAAGRLGSGLWGVAAGAAKDVAKRVMPQGVIDALEKEDRIKAANIVEDKRRAEAARHLHSVLTAEAGKLTHGDRRLHQRAMAKLKACILAMYAEEYEQAFVLIDDAIKLKAPGNELNTRLYGNRSISHRKRRSCAEAVLDAEEALAFDSARSTWKPMFNRGLAWHDMGLHSYAVKDLRLAEQQGAKVDSEFMERLLGLKDWIVHERVLGFSPDAKDTVNSLCRQLMPRLHPDKAIVHIKLPQDCRQKLYVLVRDAKDKLTKRDSSGILSGKK